MSDPSRTVQTPVPIQEQPYNAETPMPLLADGLTPTGAFYVRNHYAVPDLKADAHKLRILGLVKTPLEISLSQLRAMPSSRSVITLECAGNGRSALNPRPAGVAWRFGAVGTAEFAGTPLRWVLERAGILERAVEVVLAGADHGVVNGQEGVAYERSLTLERAMSDEVLIAWEMNGEPLTVEHGYPFRVVVPRWYAMSSVKWLARIEVIGQPFGGYWQAAQYLYIGEKDTPPRTPVTHMRVRSVIARPGAGEELARGPIEIVGASWSGEGRIERVEVSTDGGSTWGDARLEVPAGPWASAPWRFDWSPQRAGEHILMSRATDVVGNVQPMAPRQNALGYGNNGVHRVSIVIRD